MKNFALLDENNKVINISVANETWDSTGWIEYENKDCGIDFTYDAIRNVFIPPQPWSSWILNENTCRWEAPIPYPTDGKLYAWFETNKQWIEITNS